MALRVNYNFQAEFGHVNILKTERNLNTSLERLETGYRINSAKDDAAGLFIADQLNLVADALDQGVRNSQDGISAAQIAETTLSQIYDKLTSIYTKAEQAANDVNSSLSRSALQEDIDKLIDAIDRIASSSEFNGKKLLDGSFKNQYIHYGPRADQKLTISIDDATVDGLSVKTVEGDGKYISGNTNTLASLLAANTDFSFDSGDKFAVQGEDLSAAFATGNMVDAAAMAEAINRNDTLQKYGIEATAVNTSTAAEQFGTISVGSGGLDVKIYVGKDTTADITLNYNEGQTIDINQIINDINTKAKTDNIAITAKDDGNGKLVLETDNGETIAVELVSHTASSTPSDYKLSKFLEGASSSALGTGTTGSAVKIGDLTIISPNSYGYDFTGLTSTSTGLGVAATGSGADKNIKQAAKVDTNANAETTLKVVNALIKKVDRQRATLGSIQINLETIIQNNEDSAIQQREAESRIRNVDFAKEMANFTKQQTLMQSGMAMLAQANQLPQMVLQLLR